MKVIQDQDYDEVNPEQVDLYDFDVRRHNERPGVDVRGSYPNRPAV